MPNEQLKRFWLGVLDRHRNYDTTWFEPVNDAMLYIGSTSSHSFNNEMCSPFEVTWWVDRTCRELSAQNMDRDVQGLRGLWYRHEA